MGVFKRGDIYYYKFVFAGRLVYKCTRQGNKKIALQLEGEHKVALQREDVGIQERPVPRFDKAVEEYLAWKKRVARYRTYLKASYCTKPLVAKFGNRKLTSISVNDVLDYQSERAKESPRQPGKPRKDGKVFIVGRTVKPATVNRELATLRELCNFWHRQGVRIDNPVSKIKFQEEDADIFHVLTYEEEAAYLAKANQPLKDIALIMLQTAMRPEEVYHLTKKSVNFVQNYIQVERGKTKAARRRIYMTPQVREILKARHDKLDSLYLFPRDGDMTKPMVKVNAGHYGALVRMNKGKKEIVKFRLYDLRHTAATRLAQAGTDLVTLAAILGHSKIQMVLRYAHPVEKQKAMAMIALAGLAGSSKSVAGEKSEDSNVT